MSDLFNQPTFETWYEVFPRKVGKVVAQKAYSAALKAMSPQALQDAVEAFAAIENERTGYQSLKGKAKQDALKFVVHPATWLNQGRWDDEVITEYMERAEETRFKPIEIADDDPFKAGKMELIRKLGPVIYQFWVEALKFEQGENEVIIHAADRFRRDWIKSNHGPIFEEVFKTRVRFVVKDKNAEMPTPQNSPDERFDKHETSYPQGEPT